MKLVSMKLSKAEAKADMGLPKPAEGPRYPYGLELRLDGDQLDKLAFEPEVGTEVTIAAKGIVTAYRESQRQGRDPDCSAEIQITDLGVSESPEARRAKAADKHLDRIAGR